MKKELKKALLFGLCLLPVAAVGGYFTGRYAFASYTSDMQKILLEQLGSVDILALVSMGQSLIYAFLCGVCGYLLSVKIGLMKPFTIKKQGFLPCLGLTVACGVVMALDYWIFGSLIPGVKALYQDGLLYRSLDNWLASIFYGGIIEEVLMRLLLMSLFSWLFWKLFCRKAAQPPVSVFIWANILSALLFALGHLPAAAGIFGGITVLVLVRTILLNGVLGVAFGWLYRRYGIQYAMIGHAGTHIISKLIWLWLL